MDGSQETLQKDRHVQDQEQHRPELFWVDEDDLLEIKFNIVGLFFLDVVETS
jgi:hypothetical protein